MSFGIDFALNLWLRDFAATAFLSNTEKILSPGMLLVGNWASSSAVNKFNCVARAGSFLSAKPYSLPHCKSSCNFGKTSSSSSCELISTKFNRGKLTLCVKNANTDNSVIKKTLNLETYVLSQYAGLSDTDSTKYVGKVRR